MEIAFDSKTLRDVCENEGQAGGRYDATVAKKLKSRLADLRAAETVFEIPSGSPTPIGEIGYTVNLCDGYKIFFQANHVKNPELANGGLNWSKIKRIRIEKIEKAEV